jgi:hypothetical protein
MVEAQTARGAVLLVAGLIEMAGGRVTFPSKGEGAVDLQVNMKGDQFDAVIVVLSKQGNVSSCVVPEPVKDARIIAVVCHAAEGTAASAGVNLYDLTDVDRQSLGGFSVIQLEGQDNARFKAPGVSRLLAPLESVEKIADTV